MTKSEAQAGGDEAAAQDQEDDTLTAADELAPLQVTLHMQRPLDHTCEVVSTHVCSHVTCLSGHARHAEAPRLDAEVRHRGLFLYA